MVADKRQTKNQVLERGPGIIVFKTRITTMSGLNSFLPTLHMLREICTSRSEIFCFGSLKIIPFRIFINSGDSVGMWVWEVYSDRKSYIAFQKTRDQIKVRISLNS